MRKTCFRRFGTMLDCSRNAVPNAESLRKWIDITAELGYNTLLLYTEDTYEVDDNPYFGYMRGRFTQRELKEADSYARSRGMELIPCIQTLAHLNAAVRWPAYAAHVDTGDILLAGDPAVYELIDRMFAGIARCFSSRIINVGMDEAHMIGRGRYYDLHGDSDRFEILLEHLKKVADIGRKYGFTLCMWSDMFFRLAAGGDYYNNSVEIKDSISSRIPDNVRLIYWDYYSQDPEHYDKMLAAHERIGQDVWFAGGLWTWTGVAPHNGFSIKATSAALKSCMKRGVRDVFLTMWGDNGGECSRFAVLPALFYAAQIAAGNTDEADIKARFKEKFGISFDSFMLLDLPQAPGYSDSSITNPDKYLLYNDCFTGLFDSALTGEESEGYAACARRLGRLGKHPEWGYLFETEQALCEVLAVKAGLGAKTRRVYSGRNREELGALIDDYNRLLKKLKVFHKAFRKQWFAENKPHGFDVQDIRLGGLAARLESCRDRLVQLRDGSIEAIPELEETQLDVLGGGEKHGHEPFAYNNWEGMVTANVI